MDSVLHNGTVHGTAFRKAGVLDIRGGVCVSVCVSITNNTADGF